MLQDLYIQRLLEKDIRFALERNPATAVLGPRQCGKSTLVKELLKHFPDSIYLDLERPSDLNKLDDPEWFLSAQKDRLVCLDEIQRKPELFPVLRSLIDEERKPGRFLLLGSASRDLIQQSSESLAGRISYKSLTPFLWMEIYRQFDLNTYLARGGFPPSLLASDERGSYEWRVDFISTFLERDLLQFAGFTPVTMRRLWQMLAHSNGQTLNLSALGSSLGVSHTTVRQYIDLLEGTFMVRQVQPYFRNTKKRLIKSPKVYLTDPGISSALLGLKNFEQAAGHPTFGALWEALVLANLTGCFPRKEIYFYRTSQGHEVDFVFTDGLKHVVIECKASAAPKLNTGNVKSIQDLNPIRTFLVAPIEGSYAVNEEVEVVSLKSLIERLGDLFD